MWRGIWDDSKDTLMKSDAPFPGLRDLRVAPQAVPLSQVLEAMPKAASARVRPMAMAQGLAQAPVPQGVPVQRSLLCLDHFHIGSTNLLGDMLGGSLFLIAFNGPNKNSKEHRASPAYFQQPHAQCLRRVRQLFFRHQLRYFSGTRLGSRTTAFIWKDELGEFVSYEYMQFCLVNAVGLDSDLTCLDSMLCTMRIAYGSHRCIERDGNCAQKQPVLPYIVSERWWQELIDWPALGLDRSLEPFGTFGTLQVPTFFLRSMSKSVKCEIKAVFQHSNHHNHLQFLQKPSWFKLRRNIAKT